MEKDDIESMFDIFRYSQKNVPFHFTNRLINLKLQPQEEYFLTVRKAALYSLRSVCSVLSIPVGLGGHVNNTVHGNAQRVCISVPHSAQRLASVSESGLSVKRASTSLSDAMRAGALRENFE